MKFKEHSKTPFGLFIAEQCNRHKITPTVFREYTGFQPRQLQRLMSGHTKTSLEDFLWLIESIADLTGQNSFELHVQIIKILTNKKDKK